MEKPAVFVHHAASEQKTVFLVRHAQSEQNIANSKLKSGDLSALWTIAALGYDAPVSATGMAQLESARGEAEQLASSRSIDLVAHSPYQRAAKTARALFGKTAIPMVEVPELHERTVSEYFLPALLDRRIDAVQRWLRTREERVIALVGHGQFFKRALGNADVQNNVEIIECQFDASSGLQLRSNNRGSAFGGFPAP
jgi:broad specificity phosphatase PhoE